MKKILTYVVLALLGLSLLTGGAYLARQSYTLRQITGKLTAAAAVPSQTYTLGAFVVAWTAEPKAKVEIYAAAQPEKILWESVAGKAFLLAGIGTETVEETRGSFTITDKLQETCTAQYIEKIGYTPGSLTFEGHLVCSGGENVQYSANFHEISPSNLGFTLSIRSPEYNRLYFTYQSERAERFFGFGEQFSFFDLKGKRLPIFIMEQGVGRGEQPITLGANLTAGSGGSWHTTYAGVPHYITSKLRSLYLKNSEYMVFDLRKAAQVQIQVFSAEISGSILAGDTPAALIENYTEATGRMKPLPAWITSGAIVGMQGGTEKVRQVYTQLTAAQTPMAAFWLQDWVGQRTTSFGKQLWWNWELDNERYPEWASLVGELAADNVRMMVYVSPFLADVQEKPNVQRNLFQEAAQQGYLIQSEEGQPYLIQNTSFSAGMVDLSNPAAYAWLKGVIQESLVGVGASGWMADFGEALPYDAILANGSPQQFHNLYPVEWARLNREVVEENPEKELVFFTRSGFTQSPAYSTLFWLGDQMVSWDKHDGIKTAVIGMLSSGMSGFSFNHSDIGGYTTITNPLKDYHRSKELLLRWMELNAFSTIYRTHEGNIPDANVQFYSDEETLAAFSKFARVYQAWEFYRQELVAEAAQTGLPVVRHLFIQYPADPNVLEINYEQFMVGSELLVAPVLDSGKESVEVYLPQGEWVHAWSGKVFEAPTPGKTFKVAAPLGEPAVFYPLGSQVGETFRANLIAAGIAAP